MTHFYVAVISEEEEPGYQDLFEPYDENAEDEEYLEFEDMTKDVVDTYENGERRLLSPDGKSFSARYMNNEMMKAAVEQKWSTFYAEVVDEGETLDEFAERFFECIIRKDEETGKTLYGHWYNPQAHWDYWVTMDRPVIPIASGEMVDICKCKDVVDGVVTTKEWAKDLWDRFTNNGDIHVVDRIKFCDIFEECESLDEFIAVLTPFYTHAVITPDGEWHQAGKTDWFGLMNAAHGARATWSRSYRENFLLAYPDCYIRVFDCHI